MGPTPVCDGVLLLLQTPALATAVTLTISQLVLAAVACLANMYPHCRGHPWRQAVVPLLISIFVLVLSVEILDPAGLGNNILLLEVCPFRFRAGLLGVLLCQLLALSVLQVVATRRRLAMG